MRTTRFMVCHYERSPHVEILVAATRVITFYMIALPVQEILPKW
jgi:hypothetical protein